jgi:hypothetical protein
MSVSVSMSWLSVLHFRVHDTLRYVLTRKKKGGEAKERAERKKYLDASLCIPEV